MFLLSSFFLFLFCQSSLFELMTHIFFLISLFFLFLIRELLMCPLFFTLFSIYIFYRSLILNWISAYWWYLFRVFFFKEIFIFQAQRGCNGILMMFQDEQTWSYIILNYDCLIFREINSATNSNDSQYLSFFFFFFIVLSFA